MTCALILKAPILGYITFGYGSPLTLTGPLSQICDINYSMLRSARVSAI